jgi:predicted metal-dependent enzyme (double-stranded beta helix superfamily)
MQRFTNNKETNHVLIQNEWLKVVLIHWKPGKYSSIHGHPSGGCVFKVLQGTLEEKRYTTGEDPKLLATSKYEKNSIAYIDDHMAYHAVGNPSNASAISIHVYTPGIKK